MYVRMYPYYLPNVAHATSIEAKQVRQLDGGLPFTTYVKIQYYYVALTCIHPLHPLGPERERRPAATTEDDDLERDGILARLDGVWICIDTYSAIGITWTSVPRKKER